MFKRKPKVEIRSRTPTRSVPERRIVFSYHASRTPERDEQPKRRANAFAPIKPKGVTWWKQLPMIIAGLVILGCVVDALLLSTNPRIVSLATSSNQLFLRPIDTYQQAAQQLLDKSVLNRNKLTINANSVSNALEQQFPELADVTITLPLIGHRPVVYVQPDTPALILAKPDGGAFIVANSGKALVTTTDLQSPDSLKLSVITDQTGLTIQTGQPALSATNVRFIQIVLRQFQVQNIPFTSLVLPAGGGEFDVHLRGQPYFVKFNLEGEVNQQVGTFITVKNYLSQHQISPAVYVDVRVPDRAYYK